MLGAAGRQRTTQVLGGIFDPAERPPEDKEEKRQVAVRTARQESTTLAIALLASLLVWNLPLGGYVLYPFKLLATWMHELSHGIAMTACGAGFDHILVYRDTSGLAYARSSVGGFGSAVIAGAGYMGTPVWGAVLLVLAHAARTARRALAAVRRALPRGTGVLQRAPRYPRAAAAVAGRRRQARGRFRRALHGRRDVRRARGLGGVDVGAPVAREVPRG